MLIFCVLLMMTSMYQGVEPHKGHLGHYSLDTKEAHSFLHSRVKRSDPRCNTDEPYCETHIQSCMHQNEDSREHFCALSNPCNPDKTCFLSTPCPAHYSVGCSDNPCDGIPCQNLGTCVQTATGYRCKCDLGFDESADCRVDCRPGPADIVFVIDASASVDTSFEQAKTFVSSIVSRLPVGEDDFHFAVITYSLQPQEEFTFNGYNTTSTVLNAIASLQKHKNGPTYTERALQLADQLLQRSGRNAYRYIILLSDGLSTDRKRAIHEAERLRNYGKFIYTVGVGDDIEQQELLNLASALRDFGGIKPVFSWTQTDDCYNMVMSQTINSQCKRKAKCPLRIETAKSASYVDLHQETNNEEWLKTKLYDKRDCTVLSNSQVILIFDATMAHQDSELGKDAMIKLIEYLNKFNFSLITGLVSTGSHVHFDYQRVNSTNCCDKCSMFTCVQRMQRDPHRDTNHIGNALKVSADDGFSNTTGSQHPSRKFLVLFSDGQWRDEQRIKDTILKLHSQDVTVLIVVIGNNSLDIAKSVTMDANLVFYIDEISKCDQFESMSSKIAHVTCPVNMFD